MKKSIWKNLALSLAALLISMGIGELIVRNYISVRNVGPSFTRHDPFYGKVLKKDFSTRRIAPEFTMTFTSNSEGFRGPALGSLYCSSILFLGDSFTMGYGVNDNEDFPAIVRKALYDRIPDGVSIINVGMGNNGNGRWVKFLRNEGKRYNPKLVVLQIHANDYRDNIKEQLFDLTPSGKLRELSVPSPGLRWIIQGLVEGMPGLANSHLIGFARQVFWDSNSQSIGNASDNPHINLYQTALEDQLLLSLLEEVLTISKEAGWHILTVLVGIPGERQAKLEKFLMTHNVLWVVIPNKSQRPDLYYQVDGHWNNQGHRFAADRILEQIERSDLDYHCNKNQALPDH